MHNIETFQMNHENDFVYKTSLIARLLCLFKEKVVKHIKFIIVTIFKCI